MLSAVMLRVAMINVVMLSVFILNVVVQKCCYMKSHGAECRYAKFCYA